MGLTLPKTFKVLGFVGEHKVTIVIDSGASPNFISVEQVDELKLPISEAEAYGVILGTGKSKKTQGVCRNYKVWKLWQISYPLHLGALI